jgi:hypothetical protein
MNNDIYGVLIDGVHVDVSRSLHGAKCYATRNNFLTVTIRYNAGYIAQQVAHRYKGYWQTIKND